ncbi:MAG: SEC-C domain-containing protein [Planctomycetota bacterium]
MGKRSRPQQVFTCPMAAEDHLVGEHVQWRVSLEIERRGGVPAGDLGEAFLASLRDVGTKPLPPTAPREQRARDLVYWSLSAINFDRADELLAAAQALAPDELMVRAEQAMGVWPPARRVVAFRPLVADARQEIDAARAERGPDVDAWGIVKLRPALRMIAVHATDLVDIGRLDEAIEMALYLLSVAPDDAQGARYFVVPLLVEANRLEEAHALVEADRGAETGLAVWNRLLVRAALGLTSPTEWKQADEVNPLALEYIALPDRLEPDPPEAYGVGSVEEAQILGNFAWRAWRKAPRASDALRARIQGKSRSHGHLRLLEGRALVEAMLESGRYAAGDTPGLVAYLTPPTDEMVSTLRGLTRLAVDPDSSQVAAGAAHVLAAVRGMDAAGDVIATLELLDAELDMGEEDCVCYALVALGEDVLPRLYAALDRTEDEVSVRRLTRTIGLLGAKGPQARAAFQRALQADPVEGVELLAGLGDPSVLPLFHDVLAAMDEDEPPMDVCRVIDAIHQLGGTVTRDEISRLDVAPDLADEPRPDTRSPDELAADALAMPDEPMGMDSSGFLPAWDDDAWDDDDAEGPGDEDDDEDLMWALGLGPPDLPDPPAPKPPVLLPSRPDRPGRNDPCWCGSGTKYKRCHLAADEGAS